MISGSSDITVVIWDLESKSKEKTLDGHTDPVLLLAITSNNTFIISGQMIKL